MPSHFKVKEYCPNVFRNLRERFGIDETQYLVSPLLFSSSIAIHLFHLLRYGIVKASRWFVVEQ